MKIESEAVLAARPEAIWTVVSDVDGWRGWDPHEQAAGLEGPLVIGAKGWSKSRGAPRADWVVIDLEPGRSWVTETALPGGRMTTRLAIEPLADGGSHCSKVTTVTGLLEPLFWLFFGPRLRADMDRSWTALGRELEARGLVAPRVVH